MPAIFAMLRTLQCVAFGGFSWSVMCTTCLIFSAVSGLTREGRGPCRKGPHEGSIKGRRPLKLSNARWKPGDTKHHDWSQIGT